MPIDELCSALGARPSKWKVTTGKEILDVNSFNDASSQ